ncbi:flavodoxin domain-containing protein [Fusibacter ferrireducens]|uniref:Flavodoxin domain-containing protein n=1 Tax=Fusibacter ferrireducens TaxID=2785058 RepID=A0ABR9ZZ63_9FIRM|nr:flavodoxin domain-containing protein [Fusibacter ferrireducens]MBF4695747.1 flavodoxin domain-containing protein [Fusibacter ferrireducens]
MFKINNRITWVGKSDQEYIEHCGSEHLAYSGTSHNSYLIQDEKVALIDTVWMPYSKAYISCLEFEIDLDKIDYIIINNAEANHNGALPELMKHMPNTLIYCTKMGIQFLKEHYQQDWNFIEVKTGDTLELGSGKIIFIESFMLNWPGSMLSYYTADAILFSSGVFSQHYTSKFMYNDLVDQEVLYREALKYYANILTPFNALTIEKMHEYLGLNIPLNMICTSHGIIWRDNPMQIVEQYLKWAGHYQEHQGVILYDTMWNDTKVMAECIATGIKSVDPTLEVKLFNVSKTDEKDVIAEVFKSKLVVVGSPTINRGILSPMASILESIKSHEFKNKKAAGFGSYGWSGESLKIITEELRQCGFEILEESLSVLWNPDKNAIKRCEDFGKVLAEKL